MNHIFARHSKAKLPFAAKGDGCYIIDTEGKRYFDGSGGAAVSCLGHSNARVTVAIKSQLDQIAFAHTGFFTSEPAEKLADLLISKAPQGIDRVYLVSGGSEAIEAAIKLARQYFLERGEQNRSKIIARRQSYHGNTLGALAAGGNEWRRAQFSPLLTEAVHISPCYEYRGRKADEPPEEYGLRVANELETELQRLGPETVLAFMAEPVVGATAGAVPAVPGYFKRIREICDQYGILLILDEVMCGMGRTGTLFACEQDHVAPDIVTIAKGLGAGYQPIGAMLCQAKIHDAIAAGSGFFQHGHTYMGHPVAAAAAHAVISEILEKDLLLSVKKRGGQLRKSLEERFGQHPHVGDIRGRGLFMGLEFVKDRETKEAFDPLMAVAKKLKQAAFENGLICYPMSGTIDGVHGDHVLLAPPFIMDEGQVGELTDKLQSAVSAVLN
jgi:adenosylmethionine-8-amino-7-oxononanoate aminotransferase